jgi:hypothetical protein
MPDEIEGTRGLSTSVGGWRVVAAAWLVVILFVVLFAAADALASLSHSPCKESLAGAVIPRHDASSPGPDEVAASDWLERVRADAYSGF